MKSHSDSKSTKTVPAAEKATRLIVNTSARAGHFAIALPWKPSPR